ncbi:hypothetical protein CRENBAI_009161 [Crenichthys baileyi]|uniref:G-protein coupled receptors family 1 profile domain-containing protein n=1 Tax=Crenichthys baileyi TaxID=28760 RepID=A0AAV9SL52_9TELE
MSENEAKREQSMSTAVITVVDEQIHLSQELLAAMAEFDVEPEVLMRAFLALMFYKMKRENLLQLSGENRKYDDPYRWAYLLSEGKVHMHQTVQLLLTLNGATSISRSARKRRHTSFFDNSTANTNTSDGSTDFDLNVHEPCAQALSGNFNKIFHPRIYGIIFTLGIVGNKLVVLVVGYQKTVKTTSTGSISPSPTSSDAVETWHFRGFLCVSVDVICTMNLYSSVLILAFISLDRYLVVVHGTNSRATRKLLASRVI